MNDKEFDEFIKQSLDQDIPKQEDLDREIIHRFENGMDDKTKKRMRFGKRKNVLPRVAAIVLTVLVIGGGSVYAAGQALKKVLISKHYVVVGFENEDVFLNEDEFLNDLEEKWDDHHQRITEKKVQVFYPTSDDVWTKKTVSRYSFIETDGKSLPMTCTRYTYPDYETAIKEAAKDNHIFEPLYREYPHPLIYSVPDWMDSLQNRRIDVTYEISQSDDFPECEPSAYLSVSHPYHRGSVFFAQSLDWKNTERESIYLHIYLMHETSNVRTYTTREGVEFTLVDDDVPVDQIEGLVATIGIPSNFKDTMVVFTRGDEVISMHFSNLSDEEIGEILELINMNGV